MEWSLAVAQHRGGADPRRLVEEVGNVLNGVTFLIVGAVLFGTCLGRPELGPPALRRSQPHLMGWFGPRGLASIVFALIVLEECNLPHERTILLAIYLTVGLSVFAHGITAAPLAGRYGRWYAAHPR